MKNKPQPIGSVKKKVLVSLLALIAMGVLAGGVYATWLMTPPGMPTTPEEAAALIKSPRFQRLSAERKADYMERMRELMEGMTDDQRQALFEQYRGDREFFEARREVMTEMMNQRAREFAVADPATRLAILDETLQRLESARGFGRPRGREGGDRRERGERPEMTEEQRAEMQQRREERMAQRVNEMQERAATGNPQDAALRTEFRNALRARAQQLGIELRRGGRGGGRR